MGPLKGVRVVEVGGIGPGPFCGMMLSDMGANLIRVVRKGDQGLVDQKFEVLEARPRVLHEVEQTPGSGDHDVDTGAEGLLLLAGLDAAEDGC